MDTVGIKRTILENWSTNTILQSMSQVVLGSCVMASTLIIRQHADGTGRGDIVAAVIPGEFIV